MDRKIRRIITREITKTLNGFPDHMKTVGIFASFAAFMYLKTRLTPLYADDYPYSFIWDGDNGGNLIPGDRTYRRVKSPSDLFISQLSHYKTWGGRVPAHSLAQLFLSFDDKRIFDRANTLVVLAELLLSASLGEGRLTPHRALTPKKALLLTAGFFFSAPHLFGSSIWLTGSMNYLWMGLFQSAFVLPYSLKYHGTLCKYPDFLAFLSGLLSGWSSEAGAGASMMLAGLLTLYSLKRREYASWMGFGLAGALFGILLLILAPGNRMRLRLESGNGDQEKDDLKDSPPGLIPPEYLYTPAMFKKWLKDGFLPTFIRELPLQIPVILYFLQKNNRDRKTDLYLLSLESAAFAVPSVMMLAPEYPRRSAYSSLLFLLPAALRALEYLDIPVSGPLHPVVKLIAPAAALGLSVNALSSLIVDADISVQVERQIRFIKNNAKAPFISLEEIDIPSPYGELAGDRSGTIDTGEAVCTDDERESLNRAAAAYYGVKGLKCNSPEGHVYEMSDPSSRLFSLLNPLKSLAMKTREIITGKQAFDALDTIYYPLKRCGQSGQEYYVYEYPLKRKKSPVVYSFGAGSDPEQRLRRICVITKKHGHDRIDLLKLIIRKPDLDAIRSLMGSGVPIGQLCLEIRKKDFYKKTGMLRKLVNMMHENGYIVIYWDKKRSRFTFLKRDVSRGAEVLP